MMEVFLAMSIVNLCIWCHTETMDPEDFLAEAEIMKKLQHKNLIELYAVCTMEEPIFIIIELMKNGSLLEHLQGLYSSYSVLTMHLRVRMLQILSQHSWLRTPRVYFDMLFFFQSPRTSKSCRTDDIYFLSLSMKVHWYCITLRIGTVLPYILVLYYLTYWYYITLHIGTVLPYVLVLYYLRN